MTLSMAVPARQRRLYVRFRLWSRRHNLERKLAFGLAIAAVVSGVATVLAWTGDVESGPDPDAVLYLLYLDGLLVLLLGTVVARHLARVWVERRRGLAGSGLHVRMVVMFSLVAVTPAILVALFSALFLNFGIQAWFNDRVRTAVEASNAVAQAYLEEHRQSIRADAFAMANDLNQQVTALISDQRLFDQRLTLLSAVRSLSEALVVDGSGRVVARTPFSLSLEFELVPRSAIEKAESGQIAVLTSEQADRVRAVVKLNRFVDAYLIVGRFVEPGVLDHIERTEGAVAQYKRLEQRREGILITFVMIFIVVALLLLMAAVWTGMTLATQISTPISNLIAASDRVRKGDLSVRVDASRSLEEVDTLSRAFNRMASQLESQQEGLIVANRQLDERRRFTETVLGGVSAGVIGLGRDGRINLPNRSASELLDIDLDAARGRPLQDVVPEMAELLAEARARSDRQVQAEIRLVRNGRPRTLVVRIVAERLEGEVIGYVATFDDVTELVSAQRKAAWADVARRIAHEIKNPLTPIQLAAERLKRRYQKEITSDPETFSACTDTIVRRVEDIGRMVDEFSSFARMPRPDLKPENLSDLVSQAIFLERNRSPQIRFDMDLPEDPVRISCDSRQIAQALTNVLKNAAEAIDGKRTAKDKSKQRGHIAVTVRREPADGDSDRIRVVIEDDGPGLPPDQRDRLTEPYVTTRDKGTGLGLAIVKKIMEDHNGDLILENRDAAGARVLLVFHGVRGERVGELDRGDDMNPVTVASETPADG